MVSGNRMFSQLFNGYFYRTKQIQTMEFYSYLKECMKMVSLDPKIESKLKNQITYFTFSYTIFLMFKNKTQQIKLLNKNTQILPIQFEKQKELLFQFAWCLHIYIRGYD